MEQYEVRIFPSAQQDLLDVIDYLNTLSKEAALNYYDRLTSEISSLSIMPERCPRPRDLALAAKGYRYLVVGNYLVFYVVSGNIVQIRRILYARRDYNEEFYIYAKILMQYLATVIGVAQDSVSLRFGGVMLDEKTVMIALDEYEEVNSD